MLELEEALERVLTAIEPLSSETVSLTDAAERILAREIVAAIDLPHFDNSAMDGYAVRADDVAGATADRPVTLRLMGEVPAGASTTLSVEPGACVRVFTGSLMPKGADSVVMQEDTRVDPQVAGRVVVLEPVKRWENVRFKGEDIKQGASLAKAGDRATPGRLALLAACGCPEVLVARRPSVSLLATGSELREPGDSLAPGQIYESNRVVIASLVSRAGAWPRVMPLVADDLERTQRALENAFDQSDVVVTSGGVSVGDYDFVKAAVERIGGELSFWRVAIKPGKPFVFGRRGSKLLFGLPGNPVSALVTFLLLVRPALLRLQGASEVHLPRHPGQLIESLANRGDRRHFVRVFVDPSGDVRSAGAQASHVLSSVARANGLVEIPPGSSLPAGEIVPVLRWD